MRVDALIICTGLRRRPDGTFSLEGVGADTFSVDSFPSPARFPVFVRVAGTHDTAEHHLVFQVSDSQNEVLTESLLPIQLGPRPPGLPEDWETRVMIPLQVDLEVQAPGAYLVSVSVDDTAPQSHPFFMRRH